jgi:hypothetical protein
VKVAGDPNAAKDIDDGATLEEWKAMNCGRCES